MKINLGLPPSQKAGSRRQGNFFTRKVPGWRWDSFQNGYIASAPNTFTCRCGSQFDVPSYKLPLRNCLERICSRAGVVIIVPPKLINTSAVIQTGVGIIMANKTQTDISSVDGDMGTHSRTRGEVSSLGRVRSLDRTVPHREGRLTLRGRMMRVVSPERRATFGVSHRQARSKPYPDGPYVDGKAVLRSGAGSRGATPEQRFATIGWRIWRTGPARQYRDMVKAGRQWQQKKTGNVPLGIC